MRELHVYRAVFSESGKMPRDVVWVADFGPDPRPLCVICGRPGHYQVRGDKCRRCATGSGVKDARRLCPGCKRPGCLVYENNRCLECYRKMYHLINLRRKGHQRKAYD